MFRHFTGFLSWVFKTERTFITVSSFTSKRKKENVEEQESIVENSENSFCSPELQTTICKIRILAENGSDGLFLKNYFRGWLRVWMSGTPRKWVRHWMVFVHSFYFVIERIDTARLIHNNKYFCTYSCLKLLILPNVSVLRQDFFYELEQSRWQPVETLSSGAKTVPA